MDGMGIIKKGDKAMQHDFRYVKKEEAEKVKKELLDIIHEVQNAVREDFTFQYEFIGSSARNMITYDALSNQGFDFDVNIHVNDEDEEYGAEEIRRKIRLALNQVAGRYGYKECEDSTSVLTVKSVDYINSRVCHSCDFAIVYDCEDGRQQYIRFNKKQRSYTWEYRPNGYRNLEKKVDWLKKKKLWEDLRKYYIKKKNENDNSDKKSRAIFAEAVHEMCQKNGYKG